MNFDIRFDESYKILWILIDGVRHFEIEGFLHDEQDFIFLSKKNENLSVRYTADVHYKLYERKI
jgi:hypothetical protein